MYGLQDSAACYMLDTAYGLKDGSGVLMRNIQDNKNSPWRRVELPVPHCKDLLLTNANKGTVDAVDKSRDGKLGLGVGFRTNKWTVKFEENLWDSVLVQAFKVYCAVNEDRDSELDHKMFQLDVMHYFLNHRLTTDYVANCRRRLTGNLNRNCGVLDKLETGTRNDKHHSGRRKRLKCRGPRHLHQNASGTNILRRKTSSLCSGCGVPLCSTACSKYYHEKYAKKNIS
jgi:hypothetical protein